MSFSGVPPYSNRLCLIFQVYRVYFGVLMVYYQAYHPNLQKSPVLCLHSYRVFHVVDIKFNVNN